MPAHHETDAYASPDAVPPGRFASGSWIYALLIVLGSVWFAGLTFPWFPWQLLLAAAVATILFRRWFVPVLLVAILGPHFWDGPLAEASAALSLAHAAVALVLVLAASRYVVLAGTVVPYHGQSWLFALWLRLRQLLRQPTFAIAPGVPARDGESFTFSELGTAALRVLLAVGVAAVLLAAFPAVPWASQVAGLLPTAHRALRIGLLLAALAGLTYSLLQVFAWRALTRTEAGVYTRSIFLEDVAPDLELVEERRLKLRRAQQRARRV